MSNKKLSFILMALVAMSCFRPSLSFAQPKAFTPRIKTPNTSSELSPQKNEKKVSVEDPEERDATPLPTQSGSSARRLQQHGLGFGLGETFLLGDYAKYGKDKITVDLLYSYAASYSFDLLVDAHLSEHKDQNERMKLMGLNTSIKGRFVEFDNLSPYFLGGLGFYAPQAKRKNANGGTTWSDQKVTFGLNFGTGVDLRLNDHYVVGVMGQMHWPFKVQQENQSDLKGYYFKLLITGMYLF
jgi:hypothetical protein